MPACLTHTYFAKAVAQSLGETGLENTPEYIWGAQGPDFLFCHRFFPWMKGRSLKGYGNRLHSDVKPSATFPRCGNSFPATGTRVTGPM